MRYMYSMYTPKENYRTTEIASFRAGAYMSLDDNSLPIKYAAEEYNFRCSDGALKDGLGLTGRTRPPSKPLALWQYRRFVSAREDSTLCYGEDGCVYRLKDGSAVWKKIEGATFESVPVAINYRLNGDDVMIFTSERDEMYVLNGDSGYRVGGSPHLTSITVHYERLFAVASGEKNTLWFSSELDPTAWDVSLNGAGFITMLDDRGALLKVLSFHDYVYVFREYGITRLSAYGDQTQFSVSHLFTGSGRIYGDTVTLCGDRVIFLASDGLYSFDGLGATRIMKHIEFGGGKPCAQYFDGKYVLACRVNFSDGAVETGECNALAELELATGNYRLLRGADIAALARSTDVNGERLYAVLRGITDICTVDDSGAIRGTPTKKCWRTPVTDFGRPDKQKLLKSIALLTEADMTLSVICDGVEKKYLLKGTRKPQTIHLKLSGYLIGFVFACTTKSGTRISHPVVRYAVA